MHPVLSHKHSDCKEVIEQLQQCHQDHAIRKFLGYCNPLKDSLDQCLQRDVRVHHFSPPSSLFWSPLSDDVAAWSSCCSTQASVWRVQKRRRLPGRTLRNNDEAHQTPSPFGSPSCTLFPHTQHSFAPAHERRWNDPRGRGGCCRVPGFFFSFLFSSFTTSFPFS